ncbi:MAG: hypothetical protein M3331_00795, partial [Actinomycetota bacterium]|nr:hypothetical protein [Actinomycetota bacterium]
MERSPLRAERGQASPEWLGVVLLVSLVYAGMVAVGVGVPGADIARALVGKLKCAVSLGEGCGGEPSALVLEYGPEVAELVAKRVPVLSYEEGMLSLPIDYRECREVGCAQGPASGRTAESHAGEPVTLFTHVIDCRDPEVPVPSTADCTGDAAGNLYVQYWAYYPDSATAPFGKAGYHPDDWESFQVRVTPDGIEERASSHHGYNGDGGDPINDTGWLGGKSAWTDATGTYSISSGSHAGRVGSRPGLMHRWT